jgi:hypothetical protein
MKIVGLTFFLIVLFDLVSSGLGSKSSDFLRVQLAILSLSV